MNPTKHKFEYKYDPSTRTWSIFDDGVAHSEGYKSIKDAKKVVEGITDSAKMSQKELGSFFKKWKRTINNLPI